MATKEINVPKFKHPEIKSITLAKSETESEQFDANKSGVFNIPDELAAQHQQALADFGFQPMVDEKGE